MTEEIPSAARVPVDASLVAQLIGDQFPHWAGLEVRAVAESGWDNYTFHLGDRHKVRLPASSVYVSQTEKETRWLPRLAPYLPVEIPVPAAVGKPGHGYPFAWSVWQWIDGQTAKPDNIADLAGFAEDVANFLLALQRCPTEGAPPAGAHNFYRGGDLSVYNAQTRSCLQALQGTVDTSALSALWQRALSSTWTHEAVWVHGDIAWGNLITREGQLAAVIDFGSSAIGDPACDLVINWTLFDASARRRFRATYPGDDGMWSRAAGWAIWKAMLTLLENLGDASIRDREIAVLDAVLADLG